MKKLIFIFSAFILSVTAFAQELYIQTYGNPKNPSLLFLHGGPGASAMDFEITAAERIANEGFFVIVYDRRGEGRSIDSMAKFTFAEAYADILAIQSKYKIKKLNLLGYSFGGMLAIQFANEYPKAVNTIILTGAPISIQKSFQNILNRSKAIYIDKNDTAGLKQIDEVLKMDKSSIYYSSSCFYMAMQNGFYSCKNPSDSATQLLALFQTHELIKKYPFRPNPYATMGYLKNENYTSLELHEKYKSILSKRIKVYGMYGMEDGLFVEEDIVKLKSELKNPGDILYVQNASHGVFIDQQNLYIHYLKQWLL